MKLNFPFVNEQDDTVLLPLVDASTRQLNAEIILPSVSSTSERLAAFGYGHLAEQFPLWEKWHAGEIIGESLHILYESQRLPSLPAPVPGNFAFIGWRNSPKLLG